MITANELNSMLGISLTGAPNDDLTDQELRMWVVELMANDGYVDLTHAEQVFKYIKTGEG